MITRTIPVPLSESKYAEATLKLPKKLKPGQKIPLFLIFGGFESAGEVLNLVHPDRAMALASFDYPFSAPRKLYVQDALQILPQAKLLFPDTVRGIAYLADFLKRQPEVDPQQIIAVGASFGAPFVLGAAARSTDISKVVLVHGFGQAPETAEHVILRSWIPKYGWISYPFAWLISRMSWFYLGIDEPESNARKLSARQDALMITAENDSFIPRASSDALWQALQSSEARKSRLIMPGDHLMPGSDHLIEQIMRRIQTWMDSFRNH